MTLLRGTPRGHPAEPGVVEAFAVDAVAARAGVAAVILAAGQGSRLGLPSKPLARVAGVTLLERTVATLRKAGVGRVIVVIGHAKEAVAEFVAAQGLDIELVDNETFSVGNGSSAVAGGLVAGGRVLLVVGDPPGPPRGVVGGIRGR